LIIFKGYEFLGKCIRAEGSTFVSTLQESTLCNSLSEYDTTVDIFEEEKQGK